MCNKKLDKQIKNGLKTFGEALYSNTMRRSYRKKGNYHKYIEYAAYFSHKNAEPNIDISMDADTTKWNIYKYIYYPLTYKYDESTVSLPIHLKRKRLNSTEPIGCEHIISLKKLLEDDIFNNSIIILQTCLGKSKKLRVRQRITNLLDIGRSLYTKQSKK